ncbi:hypothetical protein PR048_025726 [Dryococelus australis]|uniref:Uncharacterized protein n=1 Tax=Dryococelus australis TaxID=614101 RepID=A0ABQ9GJE3_9NEOP|nr:hypothetical protein PR048_025726 [Dryococelus australis]
MTERRASFNNEMITKLLSDLQIKGLRTISPYKPPTHTSVPTLKQLATHPSPFPVFRYGDHKLRKIKKGPYEKKPTVTRRSSTTAAFEQN